MENLRFYLKLNENYSRDDPKAIMRRFSEGGRSFAQAYRFNGQGWTATDFFDKHRLGHNDDDFIEVSQEEAEDAIAAKLRRMAERDR